MWGQTSIKNHRCPISIDLEFFLNLVKANILGLNEKYNNLNHFYWDECQYI